MVTYSATEQGNQPSSVVEVLRILGFRDFGSRFKV